MCGGHLRADARLFLGNDGVEEAGYVELESAVKAGTALKTGDKVYSVWMNKAIVMFEMGEQPLTEGMNILGAHIDSPRLDIKQNPLYGNVICRCETVTEAEILDAIHRPLGARSMDAIKRRVRAGMGRCQGSRCAFQIERLLEEYRNGTL